MSLANAAVVVATILAWVSLLPQVLKLRRTRDPEGVSGTWPAIGLTANVGWFAYLASQRLWLAVPSTIAMVLFYGLVLRYLALAGRSLGSSVQRGIGWALLLAGSLVVGGWPLLGLVLGWSYAVQVGPSVWSAYRSDSPSGVSPGTWLLIGVEAVLWGVYGWLHQDLPIVVFAGVGVVASAAILARLGVVRAAATTA